MLRSGKSLAVLLLTLALLSGPAFAQDYNYDVSGQDDSGNDVHGSVDAYSDTKEVDGYIYDDEGNEKYFEGEWTGSGEIEGYDEDGNYIELEVD